VPFQLNNIRGHANSDQTGEHGGTHWPTKHGTKHGTAPRRTPRMTERVTQAQLSRQGTSHSLVAYKGRRYTCACYMVQALMPKASAKPWTPR